jgi:hypothetical protein
LNHPFTIVQASYDQYAKVAPPHFTNLAPPISAICWRALSEASPPPPPDSSRVARVKEALSFLGAPNNFDLPRAGDRSALSVEAWTSDLAE